MPAAYHWLPELGLTVGVVSGEVRAEEIVAALDAAAAAGRYPAGADRVTIFDQTARLHRLELDGLRRVQRRVADNEARAGLTPRYRSALICADRVKRPVVELYRVLWMSPETPEVAYRLAPDAASAMAWLGRPVSALTLEAAARGDAADG